MTTEERLIIMEKRLARIERKLDEQNKASQQEWISQEEAMRKTGHGKSSLYELRKSGILTWTANPKGRKIQYLKTSVDKYLNQLLASA